MEAWLKDRQLQSVWRSPGHGSIVAHLPGPQFPQLQKKCYTKSSLGDDLSREYVACAPSRHSFPLPQLVPIRTGLRSHWLSELVKQMRKPDPSLIPHSSLGSRRSSMPLSPQPCSPGPLFSTGYRGQAGTPRKRSPGCGPFQQESYLESRLLVA